MPNENSFRRSLSAKEILDRISELYKSCRSYLDKGEIKIQMTKKGCKTFDVRRFFTFFLRPSRFSFQFRSRLPREKAWRKYGVYMKNNVVKSLLTDEICSEVRERSLNDAIASAAGISGGSAVWIPNLLMPDLIEAQGIRSTKQLKRLRDEVINDVMALKIEGRDQQGSLRMFWIDKEQFLIRRIYCNKRSDRGFITECTIDYFPTVNLL